MLHMSRRVQNFAVLVGYILNQTTASFGGISNSIKILLVGRVPDLTLVQLNLCEKTQK